MNRAPAVAALAVAGTLIFAGCTPTPTGAAPTPSESVQEAPLKAADIATIDDGIAWARGLEDTATSTEISNGIIAIGKLVPEQDIWFDTSNDIGIDLIQLNAEVLGDPNDAASKVDDLNDIVDDIETAITKGNKP